MSVIGIITARDMQYHPNRRLMETAAEQGHAVIRINPYRRWPGFRNQGEAVLFQDGEEKLPDAVLPRQGADVGPSCLALIRQIQMLNIPVINDFEAVRISRHQFYTLQALSLAGIPFPDSIFINSADGFFRAVNDLGGYPVVVKQVSRRQGSGVLKVDSAAMARTIITDHLEKPQKERQGLLIQRYLPPLGRQDIRVLTIGQRVTGAQALIPMPGDFRANFHLGGRSRLFEMTPEIEDLSIRAAGAVGLDIAGIDLMVENGGTPQVGEVNYAARFRGLEAATGRDIAGEIIDFVVGRIRNHWGHDENEIF